MNRAVLQLLLRSLVVVLCLNLAPDFLARQLLAQRVTPSERQAVRELKSRLEQTARFQRSNRWQEAAQSFELARKELMQLATGARTELAQQLQPEYQRLVKVREAFDSTEQPVPPIVGWEELLQSAGQPVSFRTEVAPILVEKCGNCHVDRNRGNFSSATFEALDRSTRIAYGLPDDSRLIEVIVNGEMPQGGLQVTAEELGVLKRWIQQGAKFDGADRNQNLRQLIGVAEPRPATVPVVSRPTGKETVSFGLQIAPILVENCGQCHMVNNPRGNFSQVSFESLLRGGGSGNSLVPGKPEESLLYRRIAAGEMPPAGKLPQSSIDLIKTWIVEGARFDGSTPRVPLTNVAAVARAGAQSHLELSADRTRLALQNWRLVMDRVEPGEVLTPNFRIYGSLEEGRLQDVGKMLEQDFGKILNLLKAQETQPAVKGNLSVFVFDKRYDYGEFGKMVEGRDLPKEISVLGKHSVTDSYLALLLTRNQSLSEIQPAVTGQVAALYVAQLSDDIPRWFSEGVGSWVSSRLHSRAEGGKSLEVQSLEAIASLKNPADLLADRLEIQQVRLIGFQMVKNLKKKSANFDRLMQMLQSGQSFEASFQAVYGYPLEEIFQQK
jgi:mono/diheme cytochrome c family protein